MFSDQPGKLKSYACEIRLKDDSPICVTPYPILLAKQKAVEDKVKRMVDLGIIESKLPYSIPIVPLFKKNGEVRLCLDARKINAEIIPDCERPMAIKSILEKFQSIKCIGTLDLHSGYWQILLAKKSRVPCSFLINGKNYSYKRLPFELNISDSEFQKCMDKVLGNLIHGFVTIYVDDILITSDSPKQFYQHIKTVLERFKKYGVTVNMDICQFFRIKVTFLGHIISSKGIKMNPEKI